ncbi:MAG TPA: fasciclin domain-containing protein [Stellaceae bacterium]|nr:fasciclin domain-containing protein [Stellaceae bacterium]
MNIKLLAMSTALTLTLAAGAMAQTDPMVGGAAMYPTKNIVENAVNSKDHTTLVAAVKAGGLVQTLEGPGPFTVFAPTNEAFAALPPGTVDNLVKPENKATLDKILTYHVVPGRYDKATLEQDIKNAGGRISLKTAEGEPLIVSDNGGMLMVTDSKGGMAQVTIPDVFQSNGVIMVVNKVLMP